MSGARKLFQSASIGSGNMANWWARRAGGGGNVLELDLSGHIAESSLSETIFSRFFPSNVVGMREALSAIKFAAEERDIKVLLLRISDHDLGWGRAFEIVGAVKRFRAAGKHAVAFMETPENADTLIAAACDKIVVPPGAPVYLTGLLSEVMYFKGLLDKFDVKPELFQAGKYKSAVEPYTRKSMSKAHRESVEAILDGIYGRWTRELSEGRGLPAETVADLVDQGPWLAETAKEAGLLDELLYEDQVDDYLEKWLGIVPRRVRLDRFLKVYGPRPAISEPWKKTRAIAIVTVSGTIHGGENRQFGAGDSSTGADTLRRALNRAREDGRICAVVLRVDSPGGSAVHSDLIWREVERLRAEKPVVASMGDVAASGGYYIAMPADEIVASPCTLTGSIGVIGGKINLKGLYDKVGINKEQVKRGKNSDIVTDYGALSPELRKKLQAEMENIYKIFVDKAARARKQEYEQLHESAQGRVWTGEQARERGLVDTLGGLMTSIERAKERAGVPADRPMPVVMLPKPRKFALPAMPFPLPIPGGAARAVTDIMRYEPLADTPFLAMLPYMIKIK